MKKKLFFSLALALAAGAPGLFAANQYGIPDNIQDCNILHCFDWTFSDIKAELPKIAEAGFGAIQVSPVQGNCLTGAEWFYAYMPYDFAFKANGNGTRAQLQSLCKEAEKYGIKIVVDVVANHVNQAAGYHDTWWDSNGRVRWNGGVDYGNRYSITHNQLGEYGDVNSEDAQVQARAKAFIEDLKSLGVKGIRWDAAKHIGLPSEGCDFWPQVCSVTGMWHYGEILDGPGGDKYKLLKEYTDNISVTDSEYSDWTRSQVCNGQVPTGGGSWTANGVPSTGIVYWGESHDTYSNDGQYGVNSALISQDKIDRAWAIGACRNGESSLYFSRPAATSRTAIKMGQKGSTHFTSKEIAAVNHLRNAMVGTPDYYSHSNGVACITRAGGGACIVVGAGGSRQVSVANGGEYVPAGTYVDEVSGNTFTVTSSTISGQVGPTGIAVIYGEVRHEPSVTFSPNGGNFHETVTVTITAQNATSAWYKIGTAAQVDFTGTKTITLGADMEVGESVTVSWSATGEEGTKSGAVTFTKTDKPTAEPNTIYYDNSSSNWATPYVHYWGGTTVSTWPGEPMTKVEGNIWKKQVPEGTTGVIFNAGDGDATKTDDFTCTMGHIYTQAGDQGEYGEVGGGDEPGGLVVVPDDGKLRVFFDNTSTGWTAPYVHYWGGTDVSTWPGAEMSRFKDNVWVYVVPEGTTGLLFNAGDGDASKTPDFVFVNNHIYTKAGDRGQYATNQGGGDDPRPVVDMPDRLYIIGTVQGIVPAWNTAQAVAMTKYEEGFRAENLVIEAAEDDVLGYFSFITTTGATWDEVNLSDRYGSAAGLTTPDTNTPLTQGEGATIVAYPANVSAMGATAWSIPAGCYNLEANFKTMKLTLTDPAGVEEIVIDLDQAPVYFDMQGRRVLNPAAGIYIVRRGSKVSKEYVR